MWFYMVFVEFSYHFLASSTEAVTALMAEPRTVTLTQKRPEKGRLPFMVRR